MISGKAYTALQPDSQGARKEEDLIKVHSFRLSALHEDDQDRALSGDSDRSSGYFSYNYRSDSHGYSNYQLDYEKLWSSFFL